MPICVEVRALSWLSVKLLTWAVVNTDNTSEVSDWICRVPNAAICWVLSSLTCTDVNAEILAVLRLCNCSSVMATHCAVPKALVWLLVSAATCAELKLAICAVFKSASTAVATAAKSPASSACNLYSFRPLSWVAVMARTWVLLRPRICSSLK